VARAYALSDGNAFYCACERVFDPHVPVQDQSHGHSHDKGDLAGLDQAGEPQGSSPGHDGAHHHADANAAWPPLIRAPETSGEQIRSKERALRR
jgi:hypothetical protein